MKSNHEGNGPAHVTETPDVSHIRNVDVTHETSDVSIRGVATFIVALTIMAIIVHILMWAMFGVLNTRDEKTERPASPMALSGSERLPPEPRLQAAPGFGEQLNSAAKEAENSKKSDQPRDALWEINVLRDQWAATLKDGAKDQNGNVVVIPIEDAKKQLLEKGLPSR